MREAMFLAGLPVNLQYSITYSDTKPYDTAALEEALDSLPGLPDCFVAANDSIAINLINALNTMNVKNTRRSKDHRVRQYSGFKTHRTAAYLCERK